MPRTTSLAVRLGVVIALSSAAIFATALGYNYHQSRVILLHELEDSARTLASSLVNRVETQLTAVTKVTQGMARALENDTHQEARLLSLLQATVADTSEIHGAGIAFEPYAFNPGTPLYAPYYYRDQGQIAFARLEQAYPDLPYPYWDWYQIPRELGQLEWSEPYFDEGAGNVLMATCATPFYGLVEGKRQLRGIVSADVSLSTLTELVSSVKILKTGYAALLSRNGMILAHPLKDAVMNESFFTIAEARQDPALRELGRRMIRGESGFLLYQSLVGVESWMYYAPIRSTGWTLTVVFPKEELLENVRAMSLTMAAIGLGGILLLVLAIASISRAIIRPLRVLTAATGEIASGNFDLVLPDARSNDEVGELTHHFQVMEQSLKDYIRNLTEITAAKERIQSELKVATQIQASLLPRIFPPFPEHTEFEIFATMVPAKEVGGDFYDFFFIDATHLCFLIADVSDKGVPAALYMMVTKTLLKTEAQRLGEPDRILASVNDILAADNDSCTFSTVFCAVLDIASGEVCYANAGHNPPLLTDARGVRYLNPKPGRVLGALAESQYYAERLLLDPDAELLLYTDGVTEANDPRGALYGEKRLRQALEGAPRENVTKLVRHIQADVARHVDNAPQSDDITLLAIRMTARSGGETQ